VPEKIARHVIRALDNNPKSGFPPKNKLFGSRRYWPAVKAWFDKRNGGQLRTRETAMAMNALGRFGAAHAITISPGDRAAAATLPSCTR
jgi:hypothetical protein